MPTDTPMYPYGHDPSLSSALSRDAEMATTASQRTSTAPTSTQPPEHLMRPSLESAEPNHGMLFSSNTLPALAGRDSHKSRALPSSVTWTSSSGDLAMFSDTDEIQDRRSFIQEYNRLAKKHGIRVLVAKDFDDKGSSIPRVVSDRRRWWSRVFRSPSSGQDSKPQRSSGSLRHKRSVSDMALHLVHSRRPEPKAIDLQTMVRLCGKSFLYLPPEYCPGSLVLPTCFRATAQYLLQYGPDTRGVFRIPGSVRVVSTLFDYYCYEREGEEVTSTIRCPTLPSHINAGPHEVASTFKKLLSVLPGGILGSLSLFDALVAIHSQLRGEPELSRTKTTKLRARLIALAIGTVESQFRRELICAVFGLLSVIGRAAETAAREDDQGRPLPTSDLMGYTALGIVFGPLLMSELLDSYTMKLATPSSGLVLLPLTPTQLRREKIRKDNANSAPTSSPVDKIHVANDITEMLIANWREIVRNMKNLGILSRNGYLVENTDRRSFMRTSSSEGFTIGLPKGWKSKKSSPGVPFDREASPTPDTPTPKSNGLLASKTTGNIAEKLDVKRSRPKMKRSISSTRLSLRPSLNPLSPTAEESFSDDRSIKRSPHESVFGGQTTHLEKTNKFKCVPEPGSRVSLMVTAYSSGGSGGAQREPHKSVGASSMQSHHETSRWEKPRQHKASDGQFLTESPRVSDDMVPDRISSKLTNISGDPTSGPSSKSASKRSAKTPTNSEWLAEGIHGSQRSRGSPDGKNTGLVASALRRLIGSDRSRTSSPNSQTPGNAKQRQVSPDGVTPCTPIRIRDRSLSSPKVRSPHSGGIPQEGRIRGEFVAKASAASTDSSHQDVPREQARQEASLNIIESVQNEEHHNGKTPRSSARTPSRQSEETDAISEGNSSIQVTPKEYLAHIKPPTSPQQRNSESPKTPWEKLSLRNPDKREYSQPVSPIGVKSEPRAEFSTAIAPTTSRTSDKASLNTGRSSPQSVASRAEEIAQRSRASSLKPVTTPARTSASTLHSHTPSYGSTSRPSGVRAMAAMFEVASKESSYIPSPTSARQSRTSETAIGLSHSRRDTPSPKSIRPTKSTGSMLNETPNQSFYESDGSSQVVSSQHAAYRPLGADGAVPKADKPSFGQLKHASDLSQHQKAPSKGPKFEDDNSLPSLGSMVRPAEEPPIAQHVNFPRPPSSRSMRQVHEEMAQQRSESPSGNSILHRQIRTLQKQLEAKTEEASTLMRQVEAREDLDVGTLSEQLRAAKRECAMWKARAEAAEKRVATLERFTRRLRAIQGGDGQYECDEASSLEPDSREGAGIENEGVLTPKLGETLHPTGVRKTSDGGAAAWWNEGRLGRIEFRHMDMNGPAFLEVIEAVQELLEGDEVE